MSSRRTASMSTSTSLLNSSGSGKELRSHIPSLSDGGRMSLKDIMIWRQFTRNLKLRVQSKQFEKRSFCWWDNKSLSGSTVNRETAFEVEPTYKMDPERKPSDTRCKAIIDEYLQQRLTEVAYESANVKSLSGEIADQIKTRLKSIPWPPRYKCVCYVSLGQKTGQGLCVSSMCAWDSTNDSYITCSYQNSSIFCVVTVFAVYHE
ncbi:dynein light chain Tctex-type 5-B-like isoform X2 [Clavelina lepadiformis]|uniref:Uncharacterized protein n=1 Tax=Clavelina lepadiformis TaxID=159417 RepID=A0ABP0GD47_CLALP